METDTEYSIDLLKRILEIYSPSGREEKLASFLADELERVGFEKVWRDKAGNVYGEVGLGSPTILLCGHMDTVPGWIPVRVRDGKIYGRGAVDAKSSLAAMVVAALSLKPGISKGKGRVIVACVVDEEGKGRGIRQLVRERLNVEYAIFGEPSGIRNITFAYKGHLKLRITCKTAAGHVGAQHLLSNAIEKGFEIWSRLKKYCERRYSSRFGVFYSLTPTIVGIFGRGRTSSVPDLCTLNVDLRLPPKIKCGKAVEIVSNLIEDFLRENPELSVDLKATNRVEPYVAKRNTVLMKSLRDAIFDETGEEARLIRKTGTGDMNIFGLHFNVPVATYGPGDSSLSHTFKEHIEISDYLTGIKIYKRTVEKILES